MHKDNYTGQMVDRIPHGADPRRFDPKYRYVQGYGYRENFGGVDIMVGVVAAIVCVGLVVVGLAA